MRLGVSPAATSTPTGVLNQRFEALSSHAGTLGCEVCQPVHQLPPCWPAATLPILLHNLPPPWVCQPPPATTLPRVLSARLPISTPPTGLDECFFFISLVVGCPYSSIFCQFWLFFVFKLLLSFWLCEEEQCVYLCLHLGWKSQIFLFCITGYDILTL